MREATGGGHGALRKSHPIACSASFRATPHPVLTDSVFETQASFVVESGAAQGVQAT